MKHDMKKIRDALHRMHDHAVNNGPPYMRIPADSENDADLILSSAIDELEALRKRNSELETACARAELRAYEHRVLLVRCEKYAREDRAVTPGLTRLARVNDEIRRHLSLAPDSDERLREVVFRAVVAGSNMRSTQRTAQQCVDAVLRGNS